MSKQPKRINGQYLGRYTNINKHLSSFICVNIDHIEGNLHEAHATIFAGPLLYTTSFRFHWGSDQRPLNIKLDKLLEYSRDQDGNYLKSNESEQQIKNAEVTLEWQHGLRIHWKTDKGDYSQTEGLFPTARNPSTLEARKLSWSEFKSEISGLEPTRYVFRGQSSPWKLRTSFHRSNRANLSRYYKHNLPDLQHYVSSIYKNYFDIKNYSELLSFMTIAQHHGYPTPILDWTVSPYIAAYFAFYGAHTIPERMDQERSDRLARIYKFDLGEYTNDFPQVNSINDIDLHVSFTITPPLDNPRAILQQSISCVSTIDDIETYLDFQGKENRKQYLVAYDIPIDEHAEITKDLQLMGITHASLFPGLDGICLHLKQKHFPVIDED
jgi:hypothetical protein